MELFSSLSTPRYRWLAWAWTAGIVAACSVPAASLSTIGPALSADKAIHVGLFAVFGGLWMRTLCPPSTTTMPQLRRQGGRLLAWGTLFGAGIEVYQHVLPLQRQGDPYDVLANGSGLLLSVIVYALVVRSSAGSNQATAAS